MQQKVITTDAKTEELEDEVRQSQSHFMCLTEPYENLYVNDEPRNKETYWRSRSSFRDM
jgi:hypothetical protein